MGLTRDQILAAPKDRKPVRIEVPEWGGDVFVRRLSAAQALDLTDHQSQRDLVFEVILQTICDEDGALMFSADDRTFLEGEPFKPMLDLFTDAARINGLPVGKLEEAMEDFEPAPDASSPTE